MGLRAIGMRLAFAGGFSPADFVVVLKLFDVSLEPL
jgi:hypothetical protein